MRCTACTVVDGWFPYLQQLITSMRGCVVHIRFDVELYFLRHSAMTGKIGHMFKCPLYSAYGSGLILSIFPRSDDYTKSVCRTQ